MFCLSFERVLYCLHISSASALWPRARAAFPSPSSCCPRLFTSFLSHQSATCPHTCPSFRTLAMFSRLPAWLSPVLLLNLAHGKLSKLLADRELCMWFVVNGLNMERKHQYGPLKWMPCNESNMSEDRGHVYWAEDRTQNNALLISTGGIQTISAEATELKSSSLITPLSGLFGFVSILQYSVPHS